MVKCDCVLIKKIDRYLICYTIHGRNILDTTGYLASGLCSLAVWLKSVEVNATCVTWRDIADNSHCILFILLSSAPFFVVWSFVNSVAWAYGSTQALPWETVILLGCLWAFREYQGVLPVCLPSTQYPDQL